MSDSHPSRSAKQTDRPHRSLLERISHLLLREPEDRQQLLEVLHSAHDRNLLDDDALSMIEGVLQVSELAARDLMVPRAQMDVVDVNDPLDQIIDVVIKTAHSRFPVIEGGRDNVIGILLAKDLLRHGRDADFNLRDMLRPVVFIPESKRLNVLLRDFRANRHHMAVVVDEYSGVAGLITIEDVLEQIVGDIDDEFDYDEEEDNIIAAEPGEFGARWRVKALTEITQFNDMLATNYSDADVDTMGGLITNELGHVPRRGEVVELAPMRFEILRSDARQVHVMMVERLPESDTSEATED